MNTQNKFRGKRIDNGKWVYGYFLKTPLTDENSGATPDKGCFFLTGETRYCIAEEYGCVYVVDVNTVGMSTGLFDKNKNEIFAGDIIIAGNGTRCEVVFGEHEFKTDSETYNSIGFHFRDVKKTLLGYDKSYSTEPFASSASGSGYDYEIIGNIHANPELLTSKYTTL